MTLRVRLNTGALSRAVGEAGQEIGPGVLDEIVVPFLDIGPYLVSSPDAEGTLAGVQLAPFGRVRELQVDPAAGVDVTFVIPANRAWKVLFIKGLLVTAAGGLTRNPRLVYAVNATLIPEADRLYLGMGPVNGQAPSESVEWAWAAGSSRAGRSDFVGIQEIPPHFYVLGDGTRVVGILTQNLAAGDNWGRLTMQVEEFITLP